MKIKQKILLFILFTAIFMACTKDDEKTVTPTTPTSDPRSVFIGNWVCDETSEVFLQSTYQVEIFAHSTIANRIVVSNFYNMGAQLSNCQMEVSGTSITIFQQNVNNYNVIGSGTLINNSKINLTYTTDDGSGIDHVSAVYTKI